MNNQNAANAPVGMPRAPHFGEGPEARAVVEGGVIKHVTVTAGNERETFALTNGGVPHGFHPSDERESLKVLRECADMQRKKSSDYQAEESNVTQAMHYRRGVDSIHDILQGKLYRAQSILESGKEPNYESLEDTYKDVINYASFAVAWLRGKLPGQPDGRDIFNRRKK